jgi:hypothetical protein
MAKHLSVMRFLSAVLLLDIVLIGLVFVSGPKAYAFLSGFLPGTFGPGMGPGMTGNHFLGALILLLDALLFLSGGFIALVNAARNTLMIGSNGVWRLLRGIAGLSREDVAAASFAVAEEQKAEIHIVRIGRDLVWIGAVLLLLAFPAVCFTYAHADVQGAPLLQDAGGAVANTALSVEDVAVFTVDQLADAVLLDIPRVFQLHVTALTPAHNHVWLRPFVLLFHILGKLVVLAILFAAWRGTHLRAYLLETAGIDAVPALNSFRDAAAVQEHPSDQPAHVEHHLFEEVPVVHAAVEHTMAHEEAPVFEEVVDHSPQENPLVPEPAIAEPPVEVEPVIYEPAEIAPDAHAAVEHAIPHEEAPKPALEEVMEYPSQEHVPEPAIAEVHGEPAYYQTAETAHQPELALDEEPTALNTNAAEVPVETETTQHQLSAYVSELVFDAPATQEPAHIEALGPIPVEPVHREPEQTAPEAMPEAHEHEHPSILEPSIQPLIPDAPVHAEPAVPAEEELALSDAPLSPHDRETPEEPLETNSSVMDDDGPKPPFPYRNTALHMPQEFDA